MKKILIIPITIILFFACNSTPELSKEAIQGTWTCFDYTMKGANVDSTLAQATKDLTMKTLHTFSGDTLIIKNDYFTLGFACDFKFDKKEIICTPIGFNDILSRTYTVIDFTGEALVLQEKIQGITSTMYLKKVIAE